jgi:hypothetical protein
MRAEEYQMSIYIPNPYGGVVPIGTGRMPSLASWLGDRLHKALKLYFYNKRMNLHQQDPYALLENQLQSHIQVFRKRYQIGPTAPLLAGWTEKQVTNWVMGGVRTFVAFTEREQITWFIEEWQLDTIYLNDDGSIYTHLGEPDFIGYSERRKTYLVLDYKTADHTEAYFENGRIHDPVKRDKLLGYAFGAKQKLKLTEGKLMKPIRIGYAVFIRDKVRGAGYAPKMVLVEEDASPRRLRRWLKRFLQKYLPA